MDQQSPPDTEHAGRVAWIAHVKRLHRNKRMLGFAGIVLGAAMLVWWKLDPTAPNWAMLASLGVLAASWVVFIYVIVARWQWVKANPYIAHK